MNQDVMDRILRCPSLPTLPAVAVRVIEVTSNPKLSLDELASIIQHDQALATKILKTVNSSFYGLRRPCSNISQALVMLGLSAVKSLALSFSLVATIGTSSEGFDFVSYWRRGLYSAVAAKCIARAAGVLQEDEAFLGGLLQDMGIVAMHRALGDKYTQVLTEAGAAHSRLVQCELAALETQHPDIGALLAQRWKLPPELVIPIRYHECPTAAPQEHAALVRCVGLGNIAHDVLTETNSGPAMSRFSTRLKDWFDLDEEAADDLLKKIAESTRQLAPLFHLNTGRFADPEQIVSRAREQAEALAERERAAPETGDTFRALLADSEQHDALTGALLPEAMTIRAESAFGAARERARPIAAVYVLIDRFTTITAAGGTEAGDAALVETATLIDSQLGVKGGMVSRLDPSAFTVLLPGLDRVEAFKIAAALKSSIEAQSRQWQLPGLPSLPITVSAGVAALEPRGRAPFPPVQMLFLAARRAAEAAVEGGGNCVRAFTPRAAAA